MREGCYERPVSGSCMAYVHAYTESLIEKYGMQFRICSIRIV